MVGGLVAREDAQDGDCPGARVELDDRLAEAEAALAALTDPVMLAFLDAPEDDEPLTDADRAAIAEGRADVARGDVVAWEDYDPARGADR